MDWGRPITYQRHELDYDDGVEPSRTALLIMDVQPGIVERVLTEKVFPRQAQVVTGQEWIDALP